MAPLNEREPWKSKHYTTNVLIALDELLNAVIGGSPHQTISARAWEAKGRDELVGKAAVAAIDAAFDLINDPSHCERVASNRNPENMRWSEAHTIAVGAFALAAIVWLRNRR